MTTRAQPARPSWRGTLVLTGLALAAGATLHFGLLSPAWVERVYARGLFPPLRTALAWLAGLFPFSLGEGALVVLVLAGLFVLGRALARVLRAPRAARTLLEPLARGTLGLASAGYLAFLTVWGLNHARAPYANSAGLVLAPSSVAELQQAAGELVARASALRAGLAEDEQGVFRSRLDRAQLRAAVAEAYAAAGREHALLAGPPPLVRFAFLSPLMSAFGISGIYSPFTAEAHLDAEQPDAQLGFSACHEVAHARGFAREDEANFLAWLVGSQAPEPELAYSAHLLALRQLFSALGSADLLAALTLRGQLPAALQRDWNALDQFWNPRTPLARSVRHVSETVNDTYLKSQGQAQGTHSYGRMVDLLLAERRARPSDG